MEATGKVGEGNIEFAKVAHVEKAWEGHWPGEHQIP